MPLSNLAFCIDKHIVGVVVFYKHISSQYSWLLHSTCKHLTHLCQIDSLDRSISIRKDVGWFLSLPCFIEIAVYIANSVPWSDAAFCGVWSRFTLFANITGYMWAESSDNLPSGICTRLRFKSACEFMQSDQNLHWAHFQYENTPIQIYWIFLPPKNEKFQIKLLIFFKFLLKT